MIDWYCPNKFQCNILLSLFELSPLHRWLNMKKNGVRGEIWRQNYTIILVTLCNEFILILQPNLIFTIFYIRTMNLSWFWIHATMYNVSYLLTLSHLSVFHGIWNLSWFCLHIIYQYFTISIYFQTRLDIHLSWF
jgi:hypothetical protein